MWMQWDTEGGKNEGQDWEGDKGLGRLLTSSISAALLFAVGSDCAAPAGGAAEKQRPKNEVKQGQAYKEETRKIILSLDKIRKVGGQGVKGVASWASKLGPLLKIAGSCPMGTGWLEHLAHHNIKLFARFRFPQHLHRRRQLACTCCSCCSHHCAPCLPAVCFTLQGAPLGCIQSGLKKWARFPGTKHGSG